MSFLIFLGILGSSFLFAFSFFSLIAVFVTWDDEDFVPTVGYFISFGLSTSLGTTILIPTLKALNSPAPTREVLIQVPEKVQVHTEFRLDDTVIGKEVL